MHAFLEISKWTGWLPEIQNVISADGILKLSGPPIRYQAVFSFHLFIQTDIHWVPTKCQTLYPPLGVKWQAKTQPLLSLVWWGRETSIKLNCIYLSDNYYEGQWNGAMRAYTSRIHPAQEGLGKLPWRRCVFRTIWRMSRSYLGEEGEGRAF